MGNIGVKELVVILLIILILFGAKKVPELAKGLGSGLREFKKAAKEAGADDSAKIASTNESSSGSSSNTMTDANRPKDVGADGNRPASERDDKA
jgi:sec-independent protein translocase protein TatA